MNLKEIRVDDEMRLFRHCANGCEAVSKTTFNAEVMPVLGLHGVYEFWTKGLPDKQEARHEELKWADIPASDGLDAFKLAITPVTNRQYQLYLKATRGVAPRHWIDGNIPDGKEDHPVVYVSWNDATAYSSWLSEETDKKITLPTEEQWEYAARGADGREYPWGNEFDASKCNSWESDIRDTTPVGAYPGGASPYGCQDMAGNVWEWTDSLFSGSSARVLPTTL
jgi:formylglycine-generating enzyme required for sulfatase activity